MGSVSLPVKVFCWLGWKQPQDGDVRRDGVCDGVLYGVAEGEAGFAGWWRRDWQCRRGGRRSRTCLGR